MHHLKFSEFYITNVCNLNCPECNRYNNFAFGGHQRWHEYADSYKEWSKILDIEMIGILGGEPMLNPDFIDWVKGIAELWPNSLIRISTNGTQLDRHPELYDVLVQSEGRIHLEISQHGTTLKESIDQNIRSFLRGELSTSIKTNWQWRRRWREQWEKIAGPDWPYIDDPELFDTLPQWVQDEYLVFCPDFDPRTFKKIHGDGFKPVNVFKKDFFTVQDSNGVILTNQLVDVFSYSAVVFDPETEKLTLHNSDPVDAMSVCTFPICHQFIRGKLHKCGPTGLLPEFIKQFPVDVSDQDRKLINSYQAAEYSWPTDKMKTFLDGLRNKDPIPNCKFCPSSLTFKQINSGYKKIKIAKLDNSNTIAT